MTSGNDPSPSPPRVPAPTPDQVREALRLVFDPEIGVNIVDLGLVYAIAVTDGDVRVDVTMTTPACPLSEYVTTNAEATIWQNVAGVRSVNVELVWEPTWRPDMMSEEARRQLGGS
ncbi:MAG TPA: metal-sulfur cluster assembly factor [Gemmatimonadales bacterium]|nr:metal-sulfur cluster assembly factor [Gemmatimonadales bacterium]